jgi:hypothetical protein
MDTEITENATVCKIRPRAKPELQVMTEEDQLLFLIELPWYKINSYLVGMPIKIKYIPGDQFAQLVEPSHVTR